MPFAETTKVRVMMALELPLNVLDSAQYVQEALSNAETIGGETAVTAIESYLTQFEAAQTSLNGESANAGLIRADVLEWEPGSRTAGYREEMERLKRKLANILMLDELMGTGRSPNRVRIMRG